MKKLLIANWKMNPSYNEAMHLVDFYKSHLQKSDKVKLIVCPPSIWLESIAKKLSNSHIEVGAQNISFLKFGAITGEISAPMVKKFAKYAIIGHSERRKIFHETNEAIARKVKLAIDNNLSAVKKAKKIIDKKNLKEKVIIKKGDGIDFSVKKFDTIIVSGCSLPKTKILKNIFENAKKNARIIVREQGEISKIILNFAKRYEDIEIIKKIDNNPFPTSPWESYYYLKK